MCGIVGLYLKREALRPELGALLSDMLVTMSDRGPDSAGIAIYGDEGPGLKLTLQSDRPDIAFDGLAEDLGRAIGAEVSVRVIDTHAVVSLPHERIAAARDFFSDKDIRIMSAGERMEIYKEVGTPQSVVKRFGLGSMAGSHGIGHTRMATESAVTTLGAHPFSTDIDQCLVHNGSLSNHNYLRRMLARRGYAAQSQNDTEVAASYLSWRMGSGATLGEALEGTLADLDGFFTFVVGTEKGLGVVRDPIACKPAVMAETEDYVAFGSEYRAFSNLPGIDAARVWEPEPATVYFWERS
ncbi:class II glutamine amidotransferase [Pseudoroseicyclus tamaricis]|uniref:Glutamine amidotransferase family protein n=1 Tax=Pseudoroseicyclus tamaricis TaxID=2705421 RepID=A0A6B2K3C4_9RHOB|nr:glutamine amidotransferase family protein [Pseudoroseicyclus tamaricis]NDV01036.1 glutamine amidotransferase family protein [Pseudoroseicyclus tamaricis]